ncbi:MAG TPA: hypothetical protein PKL13_03645 [bacterium]|nr:hypothetical protein [bacterium]
MLFLNILPKELKQDIKFSIINEIVKKIIVLFILVLIFYSAILLFANFILLDNMKIRNINSSNSNLNNNSEKEVNNPSLQINNILNIQSKFFKPSLIIADMATISGDGISFESIYIDKVTNKISISGFAKTRDDLLYFKNNLMDSKNYSNVNFPIENLLTKEKIIFNLSFDIKSYEY